MLLVKILLVVFFVIPILGATAFGVIAAVILNDEDKQKRSVQHV